MTSSQLKAFHAVALHGGFSAAAIKLGLTQPAVSEHIRKLEDAHGTQLFQRSARGTKLTHVGRELFAITERHAEAENDAHQLLTKAQKLEVGELSIGADAAVHILPVVKLFSQSYPKIRVKLLAGNSAELLVMLRNYQIDFAVVAGTQSEADLSSLILHHDRIIAITKAPKDQANRSSITVKELSLLPVVLREEGSATRAIALRFYSDRGLIPKVALEVSGREATQEAVAQGLGMAIISAGEMVPDQRLQTLRIKDYNEQMTESLVHLKARQNLGIMQAFLSHVKPKK